jgi:hypothetical protein
MQNWPLIRFALYETFFDNIIKLVAKNHIFIYILKTHIYYNTYALSSSPQHISDIDK